MKVEKEDIAYLDDTDGCSDNMVHLVCGIEVCVKELKEKVETDLALGFGFPKASA